jgi:transcriptional regulator with XRE-family HTH domain
MYSKDQRLEIGRRLQQTRGARDQRTFAEAVGSVQQTISKYERGEIPRSWLFLSRLAEQENVDLNWLLAGFGISGEGERGVGGEERTGALEGNGREKSSRTGREEEEESFAHRGERVLSRL